MDLLRQKMLSVFPIPVSKYGIVGSFSLPVCRFGRAKYCRFFRAYGADYGKCSSKKKLIIGCKVHALVIFEGYITVFEIIPTYVNDRKGLRDMDEGM